MGKRSDGLSAESWPWYIFFINMVNTCSLYRSRAKPGSKLSFHCLSLTRKKLLKSWIDCLQLDVRNIPINRNTRICSNHFQGQRMRRKRNNTVLTSLETKGSLNQLAEAALILEGKQEQDANTLLTLAEVCAKQCHQPTLDPLSILANVCEGSQVLQTTDARAESIGNNKYGNSNAQNIRSMELELEKLKKKELRVDNIIADEHKLT